MSSIPTERELEALKVLWALKEASVRQIFEAIDGTREQFAYTTVLSLIQTMEQKGLVRRVRKEGKAQVYAACTPRAKTFRQLVSRFLNQVFDGALEEYIVHALESKRLSAKEWDRIEALLDAARHSRRSKGE